MDYLLTRWLRTTGYLEGIQTIYRCQFKSNYLKNENVFATFSWTFWYLHEIYNVLKKKEERHRSIISGVIDSERWADLNASQGFFLKTFWKWMCYLGTKTPEIWGKVLLKNSFMILNQIDLSKAIFSQISDFRIAS